MKAGVYAAGEDTQPEKIWGRDRFLPTNFAFLDDGGFLLRTATGRTTSTATTRTATGRAASADRARARASSIRRTACGSISARAASRRWSWPTGPTIRCSTCR